MISIGKSLEANHLYVTTTLSFCFKENDICSHSNGNVVLNPSGKRLLNESTRPNKSSHGNGRAEKCCHKHTKYETMLKENHHHFKAFHDDTKSIGFHMDTVLIVRTFKILVGKKSLLRYSNWNSPIAGTQQWRSGIWKMIFLCEQSEVIFRFQDIC